MKIFAAQTIKIIIITINFFFNTKVVNFINKLKIKRNSSNFIYVKTNTVLQNLLIYILFY